MTRYQLCKGLRTSIAAGLLVFTGSLHAQTSNNGALSGTVTDSTGAAIPAATVVVTAQGTNISRSLTAGLAIRPNQVAPYRRVGKLGEWFDTGSFAAPGYGFYGNASNGSIRGPGYASFNTALYKTFPITERFSAQFRAEAFNVANRPNFEAVSTSYGAGNYGQVTSARDPRILEFALKLIY